MFFIENNFFSSYAQGSLVLMHFDTVWLRNDSGRASLAVAALCSQTQQMHVCKVQYKRTYTLKVNLFEVV